MYWIFVLGLVVFIQCTSSSQSVRVYGVKGGVALASQTWDYSTPYSDLETVSRWGIDVGAFVEWLKMPVLSFSSELHYIQKGMKISLPVTTEQNPDGTGEYWVRSPRLDYLSVSLLAKARVLNQQFSPYVIAGPRVDFLLHTNGEGFDIVLDKFQKVDFGATIGIGVEFKAPMLVQPGIELRYSPSFKDGYSTALTKVRNSSVEFLLVLGI